MARNYHFTGFSSLSHSFYLLLHLHCKSAWRQSRQNATGGRLQRSTVPVLLVAFPPVPLFTGDALLPHAAEFPARKIRSAWVQFRPGHWALGLQKLPLVRFNARAWVFSTNAPGSGLSQAFSFKSCLKIGNVPNSEGFFRQTGRFDAAILWYCMENQRSMAEKGLAVWAC